MRERGEREYERERGERERERERERENVCAYGVIEYEYMGNML